MQPGEVSIAPEATAEHATAAADALIGRQRQVFVAIVLHGVPLDALVIQLAPNRNAIYKTPFDARRKVRAALAANGYLDAAARPGAETTTDVQARRRP